MSFAKPCFTQLVHPWRAANICVPGFRVVDEPAEAYDTQVGVQENGPLVVEWCMSEWCEAAGLAPATLPRASTVDCTLPAASTAAVVTQPSGLVVEVRSPWAL